MVAIIRWLASEVKLVYRTKIKASDRPSITTSEDARRVFIEHWDDDTIEYQEEFKVLLMNRSNKVLGVVSISKGGISGTVTDVRMVFQALIKANASGFIVAHNHPSGNTNPSESDTRLTAKFKEAGLLMDIQLLDHLIICPDGEYYSFADNGMI